MWLISDVVSLAYLDTEANHLKRLFLALVLLQLMILPSAVIAADKPEPLQEGHGQPHIQADPDSQMLELLMEKQEGFPQHYRLYKLGNLRWTPSVLLLTIQKNGDYNLELMEEGENKSLKGLSLTEAQAMFGFSSTARGKWTLTYHLQALVDSEPTIYHVDMDFRNRELVSYRVRGLKVSTAIDGNVLN